MKIITQDEHYVLAQREIKVFPVIVSTTQSTSVFANVRGVVGGCLQTEGRDYLGKTFTREITLQADTPKRFWFYVQAPSGTVDTTFSLCFLDRNGTEYRKDISLTTTEEIVGDEQFDDIHSLRRLVWLNSGYAIDESIPKPYLPLQVEGKRIKLLGRELQISDNGLPAHISTYFDQGIRLGETKTEILSAPVRFAMDGQRFKSKAIRIENRGNAVDVLAESESKDFIWRITAKVEFDGFVSYQMQVIAKRVITVDNVQLFLPIDEYCRTYFMGLGRNGGTFDGMLDWKWNARLQQDSFWVGNVNAGLKIQLKDENYRKPLVNIYYAHKPLVLPESWDNRGKGGIAFVSDEFVAYTGERTFRKGEAVRFDFTLLITPLKELDWEKQSNMRFYHKLDGQPQEWLKSAQAKGANIINVHHGNDLNPYINYPFFETEALASFVQTAHASDVNVKVYYTIRELTINAPEFSALRDFGYECIAQAGANVEGAFWQSEAKTWIRKTIGTDVIPAWRQHLHGIKYKNEYDASVITDGCSRLCNFYVEGLRSLLAKTDVDGLYIDDVAYDRDTMKRVRKVLDERVDRYIDFHTWNHNFNDFAGHASCANIYMELFPYIDKLWIGEGFDYESAPDFWLVEMSGIPFGLMSEMLEADWQKANVWKGLTMGMTTRLGWTDETGRADPSNVWKLFDDYALSECELLGWWDQRNPVSCEHEAVKATVFRSEKALYIALANFSDEAVCTTITVNGTQKPLYCPYVERFQDEQSIDGKLTIQANQGLFILVK